MEKKKYIILDKRVSDGYYAYCLTLYTPVVTDNNEVRLEYIDSICYGDMSYWGRSNEFRRFDEALSELLEKYSLREEDIEIRTCGVFYGSCYDVLEELTRL